MLFVQHLYCQWCFIVTFLSTGFDYHCKECHMGSKKILLEIEVWATSWQNQQNDCAPSFLHADSEDWSDWSHAQADLSVRWAHSHFVGFVKRRLIYTCHWLPLDELFWPNWLHTSIDHVMFLSNVIDKETTWLVNIMFDRCQVMVRAV